MNRKLLATLTVLLLLCSPVYPALSFDGSTTFVNLTPSVLIPSGAFTICGWFNISSLGNAFNKVIVSQGTVAEGTWIGIYVNTSNNLEAASGSNVVDYAITSTNRWYHFAMTDTGGNTLSLYVDGISRGSSSGAEVYTADKVNLGRSTSGNVGTTFPGLMDDIRVYNRVLSDQEITSLFSSRCRLNITDGLLGYWRLDDGVDGKSAGGTIRDFSGRGNAATPTGGPTWKASTYLNYP